MKGKLRLPFEEAFRQATTRALNGQNVKVTVSHGSRFGILEWEDDYPPETRGQTMIDWNAETEQWEVNGQRFEGEILWCNGWHDGLNIHDPWWCIWRTEAAIITYKPEGKE